MQPHWYPSAQYIHQEFVRRANTKGTLVSHNETARFLALALCGEAGELANLMKKEWRGDFIPQQEIADEMADIRIYLEHLAWMMGVDLDNACQNKLIVVQQRLNSSPQ